MRALLLAALLAAPLAAAAAEPFQVEYATWSGSAPLGTTPLLFSPLAQRIPFEATPCHPKLLLDLHYTPSETEVDAEGVGEAALLNDFLVQVWQGDLLIQQTRIRQPGYGKPVGLLAEAGSHELRLSLANGALVEWEGRLRGQRNDSDPACNPPV